MPLVSSVYTVYTCDLRVVQVNNRRNDFPSCFLCRKCIACFLYTLPPCHIISQTRSMLCVTCNRASLCALTRTYITCTRVRAMSICPNLYNTTLEAPGTQPLTMLLCGFFWRSNRNYHLFLVLVMRAVAPSISMYVRAQQPPNYAILVPILPAQEYKVDLPELV